jgi:hypothetical protein
MNGLAIIWEACCLNADFSSEFVLEALYIFHSLPQALSLAPKTTYFTSPFPRKHLHPY